MDQMVLETQQWLNATYTGDYGYNPVTENGQTGWETIYGLTRALQIELGISEPSDNFGPTTTALCPTLSINSPSDEITDSNIVRILQGALFCKGYNPTGITGNFGQYTQAAIMQLQSDAGLPNVDGVATPAIFKALLNMDAFVLVPDGDPTIRMIQQRLNHDYIDIIGIRPCDGLYGRSTNEALIYALQVEERISEPNGYFGPTTTSLCPTLSLGSTETNFVKILQYSLYCNGFDPGSFDGQYTDSVQSAVSSFQQFMALPVTGVANMSTIKALLSSAGDTNRDALACDCATILDENTAQAIKNAEFEYVGRYLTGTVTLGDGSVVSKAMTRDELTAIFNVGLKVFPIYEDGGYELEYFTEHQGVVDAYAAIDAALNLGIPHQTTIYFAVDFDAMDDDITNKILPYFKWLSSVFYDSGVNLYRVGVYGARNICTRVCEAGYAEKSFVADMSTGFSGNLGFKMPLNWSFDQFNTITVGNSDLGFVEVDMDGFSGRDEGFGNIAELTNDDCFKQLQTISVLALDYSNTGDSQSTEKLVLNGNYLTTNYYRKNNYNSATWTATSGSINTDFVDYVNTQIGEDPTFINIMDSVYNWPVGIEHLMATLSGELYYLINTPNVPVTDFAGWAGDLITVWESVSAHKDDSKYNGDVYSCALDYIGTKTNGGLFPFEDLLGDVDATNIAKMLENDPSKTIYSAVTEYYSSYGQTRFSQFYQNKFGQSKDELINQARKYVYGDDPSIIGMRQLLLSDYNIQSYSDEEGEALVQAFVDVFLNFVNQEASM